jgi:hypothetical protein
MIASPAVLRGRRIEPGDYRQVRRALSEIADPIGRGGSRGQPLIWRLKDQPAAPAPIARQAWPSAARQGRAIAIFSPLFIRV